MTLDDEPPAAAPEPSLELFRYVVWPDVPRRLAQGYCFAAELGLPHAAYSCLMEWRCTCGREPPE